VTNTKLRLILSSLIAGLLVLPLLVDAALVELEWNGGVSGNADLTLDTSTGLIWLDLTVTEGRSYVDVLTNTQAGGMYEQFRYAAPDEIRSLYNYVSPLETILSPFPPGIQVLMEELQSKTGITSGKLGSSTFQLGITALDDPAMPENQYIARTALDFTNNINEIHLDPIHGTVADVAENTDIGSYLIMKSSVVPIPAAILLFGSGLLGLICMARRRVNA